MQHTHISLRYPIPGLSIDSALHYPTLPSGPPLATLAPKKHTTFRLLQSFCQPETCETVVTTRNPRNYVIVDAQIKIQPQTPKLPQNPKSHLKIQNLTSNPQKHVKPVGVVFEVVFNSVLTFFQFLRDVSSETLTCCLLLYVAQNRLKYCLKFVFEVMFEVLFSV